MCGENSFRARNGEILEEVIGCMEKVDEEQARVVLEKILSARIVFAVGVGRVMIMLQAFVKRLNHLGIEAYFVGAVNEPAITREDVLIVASGSGESAVPVAIAKVAKKFSPTIIYIGSNMGSTISSVADVKLRIPCRTKLSLPDELFSVQPMSSMFEQSLLILLDTLAYQIVYKKKLNMSALWTKHANLE